MTVGPESTFCIEWCGVKSPSEDEIKYRLQIQQAGKDQDYSVVSSYQYLWFVSMDTANILHKFYNRIGKVFILKLYLNLVNDKMLAILLQMFHLLLRSLIFIMDF